MCALQVTFLIAVIVYGLMGTSWLSRLGYEKVKEIEGTAVRERAG